MNVCNHQMNSQDLQETMIHTMYNHGNHVSVSTLATHSLNLSCGQWDKKRAYMGIAVFWSWKSSKSRFQLFYLSVVAQPLAHGEICMLATLLRFMFHPGLKFKVHLLPPASHHGSWTVDVFSSWLLCSSSGLLFHRDRGFLWSCGLEVHLAEVNDMHGCAPQ